MAQPSTPIFTTGSPYYTGTPSTQTSGGSTSSSSASGPGSAYYWLQLALQGASSYANYSSAQSANRQNVSLQRDQMDWEERMANTAVQRRAADIEAAGGNRALAFTSGSEASTPVIAPAHVDPPRIDAPNLLNAKLAAAQIDNIQSQTNLNSANVRSTNLATDIREAGADYEVKYGVLSREATLRSLNAQADATGAREGLTAAQTELYNRKMDAAVELLQAQASKGTLDVQSLKQMAEALGGITGKDAGPFFKILSEIAMRLMNK